MASQATIRTRNFVNNPLLARKQFGMYFIANSYLTTWYIFPGQLELFNCLGEVG